MEMAQAMPGRIPVNPADRSEKSLKLRQHCEKRSSAMRQHREDWIQDWRQVSEYIDPLRGKFNDSRATNSGDREVSAKTRRSKIINSTATECVRVAVAGMASHMTSKSRPWFKLTTPDPALAERFDVRVWLDDVTTIITDTLANSNFYKAMPVSYNEDLLFGIAVMLIMENEDEVVRFHTLTAGTFAIGLDNDGRVDALWRTYRKTARQLVEKYGVENVTQAVRTAFSGGSSKDQYFDVQSMFEKNPDAEPGMGPLGVQAADKRPWREVVWMQGAGDGDKHGVLDIGGHYEAPFVAIRWNPVGDDVYSTCPGIDALGDIKQLQYLEGQKLRLIDLIAEPPMGLPDVMRNLGGGSLAPGKKTYLPQTQAGAKVEPLYVPAPQALQAVMEEIATVQARIRNAFFYNLFLMMESLADQTQRTAFEVAERKEEKASVLGPTLEIVTDEGLDPTVVRTYKLLERRGRIPDAPEALSNVPLKIEYTSILAQAMKAAGTSGIERLIAFVANLVAQTQDPSKFDKIDLDQAIDEYAARVGGPATIVRDDDAVAAIRTGRAKEAQQAKLMAAAKPVYDLASAIKTAGEAVPQDGSIGQGLAEQMAGTAA